MEVLDDGSLLDHQRVAGIVRAVAELAILGGRRAEALVEPAERHEHVAPHGEVAGGCEARLAGPAVVHVHDHVEHQLAGRGPAVLGQPVAHTAGHDGVRGGIHPGEDPFGPVRRRDAVVVQERDRGRAGQLRGEVPGGRRPSPRPGAPDEGNLSGGCPGPEPRRRGRHPPPTTSSAWAGSVERPRAARQRASANGRPRVGTHTEIRGSDRTEISIAPVARLTRCPQRRSPSWWRASTRPSTPPWTAWPARSS